MALTRLGATIVAMEEAPMYLTRNRHGVYYYRRPISLDDQNFWRGANGAAKKEWKAMSNMTLHKVMRDMQEPFHVHGFRSSFTDWAANEGFPNAVVEAALAHKTPDAVQAAYRRTTYLGTPENPGARVKLMEAWGNYCAGGGASSG